MTSPKFKVGDFITAKAKNSFGLLIDTYQITDMSLVGAIYTIKITNKNTGYTHFVKHFIKDVDDLSVLDYTGFFEQDLKDVLNESS